MSRILFVDDDPAILRAFQRMFPRPEYHVDVALDGSSALSLLELGDYDILLADYELPYMNGTDLLARARTRAPNTVRMLTTAKSDFRGAVDAVNRGEIFRILRKPWDETELRFSIRLALEIREMEHLREALKIELAEKNVAVQRAHDQLVALNHNLESIVHRRTVNLLDALSNALDMRDNETQQHSRRVAEYARRIAEELGLDEASCRLVDEGALLHDIGKIGVADKVLLKPGPLDDDEWVEMKRHPDIGRDLLRSIDFLDGARDIIHQHQERYDGSGYPRGLKGEQICIGARIFAVVDALDAITSDRPYRKANTYEFACSEISRCSGTHFDPTVVDAFLRLPKETWEEIRSRVAADVPDQKAA